MGLHSQGHEACSHFWAPSSFPPNFNCFQELVFKKLKQIKVKDFQIFDFVLFYTIPGIADILGIVVDHGQVP